MDSSPTPTRPRLKLPSNFELSLGFVQMQFSVVLLADFLLLNQWVDVSFASWNDQSISRSSLAN